MSINEKEYFGDFFQNDGTIDFYLRIRTLINENSSILLWQNKFYLSNIKD